MGIEHYYAETLPDQKAELIKALRDSGKCVAYIGDGINDAIALKQANVSISLSGASTAATDTAQIILMDGDLHKLKTLFEMSQSFETNVRTHYLTSMIPGAISLGGVFLFNMGVIGGLTIYFSAKILGLANSMLPLVQYKNNKYLPTKGIRLLSRHFIFLSQGLLALLTTPGNKVMRCGRHVFSCTLPAFW